MPKEIVIHHFPDWGNKGKDGYFLLLLPSYGEPGFYRQTVSFDAFFHAYTKKLSALCKKLGVNEAHKFFPNHHNGYLYYATHKDEWDTSQSIMAKSLARCGKNYKPPKFMKTFTSIWEFYGYIGFNHKTRKYE